MGIDWHIGDVIAKVRSQRRMNQTAMAKKAGVSKATIVRAEAGDPNVARKTYINIAKALGTNLAALEVEAARLRSGSTPSPERGSTSAIDRSVDQRSERE